MLRPLLVCALAVCACGVFDESDVLPARIVFFGDTADIQIPDTVTRGIPFEVVVETFGGGCYSDTPSATIVDHTTGGVTVSLFDLLHDNDACTADLRFIRHIASVTVDVTGDVLFRFLGSERADGGADRPAELRRTVVSIAP